MRFPIKDGPKKLVLQIRPEHWRFLEGDPAKVSGEEVEDASAEDKKGARRFIAIETDAYIDAQDPSIKALWARDRVGHEKVLTRTIRGLQVAFEARDLPWPGIVRFHSKTGSMPTFAPPEGPERVEVETP